MNIQFSTINVGVAWEFIHQALPEVSRENARPLLELVGMKVRIGDPLMYGGNAPVYPMPGVSNKDADVASALKKLTSNTEDATEAAKGKNNNVESQRRM